MEYTPQHYNQDRNTAESVYKKHFRKYAHIKDDLIQTAVTALWHARENFKGKSTLSTYLYQTAFLSMLRFIKDEQSHLENDVSIFTELADEKSYIDILPSEPTTADLELEKYLATLDKVRGQIAKLGSRTKKIIEMYMNRRSYDEIGACVGLSKSSVAECVKAFRKTMARELGLDIEVR